MAILDSLRGSALRPRAFVRATCAARRAAVIAIIVCALVLIGAFSAAPARAAGTYTVQPGDTIFSIAARFNVGVSDLATVNRLYDVNAIYVGQVLIIPNPLPTPPTTPYVPAPVPGPVAPLPGTVITTTTTYSYYVVQPGDFLATIAARFKTTVDAILSANYIANANLIYVGQRLVIPRTTTTIRLPPRKPVYGNFYTVQPGDTLFSIAARFKRDVYAIARANGLLNLNQIYAGMVLLIP